MEIFQDTSRKKDIPSFFDTVYSCSKKKKEKKVTKQYDFSFPSDYEGTELWFKYLTARGKCQHMQSQSEWVQSHLPFTLD